MAAAASAGARTSAAPGSNLQEILRCFICFGRVQEPHLCPQCSKMCCRACITKWLERKPQCPYCRAQLTAQQLVNCRFMDDVYSALERLETESKKQTEAETCSEHQAPLQYFCNS